MQGDSAKDSPSPDNLWKKKKKPEVFSTKKQRKGGKNKKTNRSPVIESVQIEDSGDESGCSELSTYYQLVKKPVKDIKKSVKKKTKVDTPRMSPKAVIRKSRRLTSSHF